MRKLRGPGAAPLPAARCAECEAHLDVGEGIVDADTDERFCGIPCALGDDPDEAAVDYVGDDDG